MHVSGCSDLVADLTRCSGCGVRGQGRTRAASDYLDAYDQLLRQLRAIYQEMYAEANDEAENPVHWLPRWSCGVYRRDGMTEVLLSPVHPLNLWRSVAIVRDLQALGGRLSEVERDYNLSLPPPRIFNRFECCCCCASRFLSGNDTALLGAGAIAHLPLFKEAPRGVLSLM